jgi:hypothetical protein
LPEGINVSKNSENLGKAQGVDIENILIKQEVTGFEILKRFIGFLGFRWKIVKAHGYTGFQLPHREITIAV